MKKTLQWIIAAAIIASNANFALAADIAVVPEEAGFEIVSELSAGEAEESVLDETAPEDAGQPELYASIDGITFEYDGTASTELEKVVKVRYDKTYFVGGITSFNAEISIPDRYAESVSYTTRLSGFEITDSYSGGIYKCSGTSEVNKSSSDGLLFTMTIKLKEKTADNFTISLTGDSSLGDESGTVQRLSNGGMSPASLTIAGSEVIINESFVDGPLTGEIVNEVLTLHGNGTMKDYSQNEPPWSKYADVIQEVVFTSDHLNNISENAFAGMTNLRKVTLSADIGAIDDYAFSGCSSLRSIDIPTNSGVGIGKYAFKDCSSLTSVYIPSGVKAIGYGAFEGCSRLGSVTLPFIGSQQDEGNADNTFTFIFGGSLPSSLKVVTVTDETEIVASAFEGCASIENIYVNAEVKSIGVKAFSGCSSLKEFAVPAGVPEISDYSFQGCASLVSVDIPDSVQAVGTGAFDGCSSLASIQLPAGITAVNDYTFRGCSSLTAIEIPNTVENIGADVLSGCTRLVDIKVPFVGAYVGDNDNCFGYLFGTDNASVPPAVTKVEITSANRSSIVPKEAFMNCANIEDIIIDGGRSVLENAFRNCKMLKNLYIPKSISTIGATILGDCTRIETLTIPFIGESRSESGTEKSVIGAFFGYDDSSNGMANGTRQIYNAVDYHYYKIPKSLKNVSLLNQTDIPYGAFMECDFIENVAIVTGASMGEKAFYHCVSLENATLPNDLRNIGSRAFAECESLRSINIPTKVKTIGEEAFYNDRALENVTMPDSITSIADDIFNGTELYGMEAELMAANLTITCSEGSEAHAFALRKGIPVNLASAEELDVKSLGATVSKLSTGEYLVDVVDTNQLRGNAFAGVYDSSGRLLAAKTLDANNPDEVEYRFTFSKDEVRGAACVKALLWSEDMESRTSAAAVITEMPQ